MSLVSVITPTFNRAKLIGRAIKSVLAQTYEDFELIIVDDNSTDDTQQVVASFADERIRYLRQEHNQGQNPALNMGVRAARGQKIAFLDSDDEWLPTYLERMLEVFAQDKTLGMVYTDMFGASPEGMLVKSDYYFHLQGSIYREALAQGYISGMGCLVVTRECIERLGPEPFDPDFVGCQDDDFCFRVAKEFRIGLIKEPLVICHIDAGIGTARLTTNHAANAEGWWRLIDKFKADILKECGGAVLAAHYITVAKFSFRAGQIERTHNALALARHASPSGKYVIIDTIARMPFFLPASYKTYKPLKKLRNLSGLEPLQRRVQHLVAYLKKGRKRSA